MSILHTAQHHTEMITIHELLKKGLTPTEIAKTIAEETKEDFRKLRTFIYNYRQLILSLDVTNYKKKQRIKLKDGQFYAADSIKNAGLGLVRLNGEVLLKIDSGLLSGWVRFKDATAFDELASKFSTLYSRNKYKAEITPSMDKVLNKLNKYFL